MAGYKEPGLQDRLANAQKAKEKALAKLRAKPPLDPEEVARKIAKAKEREAKQQAKREEREAAKLAKIKAAEDAQREAEAAAKAEAEKVELTEAERKQARDARYAARKMKKARR